MDIIEALYSLKISIVDMFDQKICVEIKNEEELIVLEQLLSSCKVLMFGHRIPILEKLKEEYIYVVIQKEHMRSIYEGKNVYKMFYGSKELYDYECYEIILLEALKEYSI